MFGTDKYAANLLKNLNKEKDVDAASLVEVTEWKEEDSITEEIDEALIESITTEQLDEVAIDHSRYIRSHGKRPRNAASGSVIYTNKPFGEPDHNNPREVHSPKAGEDHKKSVKAWAKEHGHHRVYTMESSEYTDDNLEVIDELSKKTLGNYVNKAMNQVRNSNQAIGRRDQGHTTRNINPSEIKDEEQRKYHKQNLANAKKREAGIRKAVGKLTKEEIEAIENALNEVEELDEAAQSVDYKKVGDVHYHRKDKGTWIPLPKHVEVKKVGDGVHKRVNKGTWVPQKAHHKFINEEATEIVSLINFDVELREEIDKLITESHDLPHPFRHDLHTHIETKTGHSVYDYSRNRYDPAKWKKLGHVNTSKGPGKYSAHDNKGKKISDNHADLHTAYRSIANHHIKNGSGKEHGLS